MPRRPVVRVHPLTFQSRTIAASAGAVATDNKEKADTLELQVESLENEPFFAILDGGAPVMEETDIFDGGLIDA
jgi:hypothetical protein|tara:strand:+ start:720 stop:941 length:222 start_codon:yes stop_codon:yes gene_type:complete